MIEFRKQRVEGIDKNILDQDEYPQTAKPESRYVRMLADLRNLPAAAATIGFSTLMAARLAAESGSLAHHR